MIACQNNESGVSDDGNKLDTIPQQKSFDINMVNKISRNSFDTLYKYFKSDFKKGDSVITKFNKAELDSILHNIPGDTVKFVVGLFDNGEKKGKPMIFLRIPVAGDTSASITNYEFVLGDLCPPPYPCTIDN